MPMNNGGRQMKKGEMYVIVQYINRGVTAKGIHFIEAFKSVSEAKKSANVPNGEIYRLVKVAR